MTIEAVIFDLGGTLIEHTGPTTPGGAETPGLQAAYDYLEQQGGQLPEFAVFRDTGLPFCRGSGKTAVSGGQNLRLVDFLGDIVHTCCPA
ncbi:MAG: hypothetical protein IPM76_20585 [Chloroflexi bacterium]|nr:hypothetical protein [Chloroflexota bacterium]